MIYYMKIENEYIVDLTSINPNLPEYVPNEVLGEIPDTIMRGYFKWNNGFVVDATKKATIDAEIEAIPIPSFLP